MNNLIDAIVRCELKEDINRIEKNKKYIDHFHDFYEMAIVLNDEASFLVDSEVHKVKKESLIIIPPLKYHHVIFNNEEDYKRMIIFFSINKSNDFSLIENLLKDVFVYDFSENFLIKSQVDAFVSVIRIIDKESLFFAAEGFLLSLFYEIKVFPKNNKEKTKKIINPLIESIVKYINTNISEKITLEDISKKFNISISYLEKLFKDSLNISIITYIREKRLFIAKNMILNGINPTVACYKVGFSDYTSFYKSFVKRFGISPKKAKHYNGENLS